MTNEIEENSDIIQLDEILPLDLNWEDPKTENIEAGGENRIIQKTLQNNDSELLAINAGNSLQTVSNALTDQLEKAEDGEIESGTAHFLIWQAVRDFKASLYLAISGHYRHSHIVRRSALEVSAYAVYFEENPEDEETWDKWVGNKSGPTSTNKLKIEVENALKQTFNHEFAAETVQEIFNERRTELHKFVHSFVGGEIENFIEDESNESFPIHPWSSYFDYQQFKNWYINFIEDMQFLNIIIHKYWDIEGEKGIKEETHQWLDMIPTLRDLAKEDKTLDKRGNIREI